MLNPVYAKILIERTHGVRKGWTWKIFLCTAITPWNHHCVIESVWEYNLSCTAEVSANRWCKRLRLEVLEVTVENAIVLQDDGE